MIVRTMACVAATLPLLAGVAMADHRKHSFAYADSLFRDCQSDVPALRGMCLGYLAAMADSLEDQQNAGTMPRRICDPPTVSLEDYRRAVVSFLKGNPDRLKKPSAEIVGASFVATWPCKD